MSTLLDIAAGRVATVATFYKVSELLGVGRYSEVYKAFDMHHQADVALKLYVGFDTKTHELAKNEEAVLARLDQLNSEYFPKLRRGAKHRIKNRNHPLLVLELGAYLGANGQKEVVSLKQAIPKAGGEISKSVPDEDFWGVEPLVRWVIHMVQAVKQLHAVGIVHRDLKPANILLKRGPGQSAPVPLFLDFNSAAASGDPESGSGTLRYLPPEVNSGRRQVPSPEDDLWAIAMIAWELIHGQGASPERACSPHGLVAGSMPIAIVDVLRRELSINAEARFRDAGDMLKALEAAATVRADSASVLGSDEVARARAAMERIRRSIGEALAAPGEIFVPKDIDDAVTTVIAWLSEEDTQSLSLVDEVVRLGPMAIPVCLQQGYRLQRDSGSYGALVTAVAKLGAQEPELAQRSIDMYALSSNIGVRALCWKACEELKYFPEVLLDSLTGDEGVLLAEERLKIADLCIRFSKNATAVLALVKYMCREYILDRGRYHILCTTVAHRMHELQVPEQAPGLFSVSSPSAHGRGIMIPLLIWQDAQNYIWEELKEFERLPSGAVDETERGLVELMAEAFAATGIAGLEVLKAGKVPRLAGPRRLPIFRRFATKLGAANAEVCSWLLKEATRCPDDNELQMVARKLGKQKSDGPESPNAILQAYLRSGDRKALNALRFWPTTHVLDLVKVHLSGGPSAAEVDLILKLLKAYETRHRTKVVDIVLTQWTKLAGHNYDAAVQVLTGYSVPSSQRQQAVELLNSDLRGAHASAARQGLEQLLR